MSLRYQINVCIFISALCILLLGGALTTWQARHAVAKEVDSSIHLAVQRITFAAQNRHTETDWLPQFTV